MSVTLSIKGVPDAVAARLRARAEGNHRSLQGELLAIVERAVTEAAAPNQAPNQAPDPVPIYASAAAATSPLRYSPELPTNTSGAAGGQPGMLGGTRRGSKTIEQLAAEHLARYPKPFQDLPLAVDIIRADRDSR